MSPAKVMLSSKELELVSDAGWILTKNTIIDKVCLLFGALNDRYKILLENTHVIEMAAVTSLSPKISKGEQYQGLPWVILDHPRYFVGKDGFAIRTFFWWGNYCSITLHLSGALQQCFAPSIQKYFALANATKDWALAISDDPWQHDFGENNYRNLSEIPNVDFASLPFLKLAKKIPLQEWNQMEYFFENNYLQILQMLSK